jgi:hypothetical protein
LTAKQLTAEEKRALSGRTEQVLAKEATSSIELSEAIRRWIGQRAGVDPTGRNTS